MSRPRAPFPPALVPAEDGDGFAASRGPVRRATATTPRPRVARAGAAARTDRSRLTDHACGREGLQLIKVTGSAFADFARDEHTTLPERRDRPLFTWMRHRLALRRSGADALGADPARYVAGEQVADLAGVRVPPVREPLDPAPRPRDRRRGCSSAGRSWRRSASRRQNRTLGSGRAVHPDDPTVKTYADPRPPFGRIGLVLRR